MILRANRILHWHTFLSLFLLLLLSAIFPTWAEETETKAEQNPFTLEVKDNLINLQSEQASFKEILSDLEKKTGIKVNIFSVNIFIDGKMGFLIYFNHLREAKWGKAASLRL